MHPLIPPPRAQVHLFCLPWCVHLLPVECRALWGHVSLPCTFTLYLQLSCYLFLNALHVTLGHRCSVNCFPRAFQLLFLAGHLLTPITVQRPGLQHSLPETSRQVHRPCPLTETTSWRGQVPSLSLVTCSLIICSCHFKRIDSCDPSLHPTLLEFVPSLKAETQTVAAEALYGGLTEGSTWQGDSALLRLRLRQAKRGLLR